MGEAVADVAELALLDVLLDGVEIFLLGDLLFGVGPAGDLDNHVEDGLLVIGVQRDIVERRDGHAILLDVDAVLQGVGLADLAGDVGHGGVGGRRCRREVTGEKSGAIKGRHFEGECRRGGRESVCRKKRGGGAHGMRKKWETQLEAVGE